MVFKQTIGYDPIVPAEESAKYNIEWMELDQLWPKADYITVHTPLIPQTKGRCHQGVIIIIIIIIIIILMIMVC